MIDPSEHPREQVRRQAKIIDALIRRASRQKDVGPSAYRAFQSAIDLQQQMAAQTLELESVRFDRERTRRTLAEALASVEKGLALFSDGRLNICNDMFRDLLPDVSDQLVSGLALADCFALMGGSRHLVSTDRPLNEVADMVSGGQAVSLVAEVAQDRGYQMGAQRTSPENVVLLLTEITTLVQHNRREKERLIDTQADYLQAVFQNMSAGVCTFSAKGEVRMHNGRFRDMLGVPMPLLQPGTPFLSLMAFMKDSALIDPGVMAQMEDWRSELTQNRALSRRVSHGTNRVLDLHANMLPDGGFVVELKDVTLETRSTEMLENRVMERTAELTHANANLTEQYKAQARIEEELRQAKERAEAAVSSKTRFLAAASHDLLQPINAAKLLISTLQETTCGTKPEALVARLEGAFASAEYLLHSLLDISRLESADPDTVSPGDVSLAALMTGVWADQMPLAAERDIRLDVVASSLVVRSDPVYLLRCVQNLVVNAIQYTNAGGRVLLGCRRKGNQVVLDVWDTGVGIARKDQARIFDEFTRAGDVPIGSGVGLGLSVVDRACRLLGHRLSVRSKPGRGSVFSIEMDVIQGAVFAAPQQGPLPREASGPIDDIVLVIENDADVLFGTTQWLEQWGASVFAARSTQEATQMVSDMGMPPDIVLADYHLDASDTGIKAIDALRKLTDSHIPAILITADRSEAVRRLGAQHDISVLTKPAELTRLRDLIDWKIARAAGDGGADTDQGPK